jgi:hypothetical protein
LANAIYPKYKEQAMGAGLNLTSLDVKVVLVDLADYTYSAAHEFLSDVPAAARVATSPNLASKTVTSGVFDAADVTFATVTGDVSEALIIYQDTGVAATSRLIIFLDTGIVNIPITPAGVDIPIVWDNGANKIFVL